ncbi:hypothetical protein V8E55_003493 [Tylopilus felleus]
MSAETTDHSDDFEKLKEKFGCFRILIIGRANAGKTTILRGICDTTENPEIYDGKGNKVSEVSVVQAFLPATVDCSQRGIHNIENELRFRSNDNLVFHDSQGFEAGSEAEFLQMKKFIEDRANTVHLKTRIHAIWYCISMDKLSRAIQRSEERFFDECNTGNIPVIVLFTKFDALLTVAMSESAAANRHLPRAERIKKAEALIEGIFEKANVWERLTKLKHAPKSYVRIGGMHKSNEGCSQLLETTTKALDERALQMMLVSAQQVNLAICMRYALQDLIALTDQVHNSLVPIATTSQLKLHGLVKWFPHHRASRESCTTHQILTLLQLSQ